MGNRAKMALFYRAAGLHNPHPGLPECSGPDENARSKSAGGAFVAVARDEGTAQRLSGSIQG